MKKQYTVYNIRKIGFNGPSKIIILFEDGVVVKKFAYDKWLHERIIREYESLGYEFGLLPEDVEAKKREYEDMKAIEIVTQEPVTKRSVLEECKKRIINHK